MQLTDEQEAAIKGAKAFVASPDTPFFSLQGYAGTGKTTVTKLLTEDLGGRVCHMAYTGKAAFNMRLNGCKGATTVHKAIYIPKEKSRKELRRLEALLAEKEEGSDDALAVMRAIAKERENVAQPSFVLNDQSDVRNARAIVVDEASMIDGRMGQDLLSFGIPLIIIGDPAQLPPVKGAGFFHKARPNAMLTKIHRQAADNPIIQMATAVREGKTLAYDDYGDSRVVDFDDPRIKDDVMNTDQLIVGLRASRATYNNRMREILGRKGLVDVGDKLVCVRNDHEMGLMNGSLWTVKTMFGHPDDATVDLVVNSVDEKRDEVVCQAYTDPFTTYEPIWQRNDGVQNFCYGYALTCHKAQGSQWDDTVVFDESGAFRENAQRWLYTALTRAAKRVTVVK